MYNAYAEFDKSFKEKLITDYMPAVKAMASRLKERLPSSVEFNELVSIGYEELVTLSHRYDSKKNDNFWGYAKKRIYGSMLDFLRSIDTLSRSDRQLVKEIDKIINEYTNEYGIMPTNEYLSEVLGVNIEKIKKARRADEVYSVMPIEEQMGFYEDVSKIEQEELVNAIKAVLKTLNEKEQLIIQLYYFEEFSLKEIAEVLEISESRVSQIHKKIIKKLREKLNG